jgi:hypothetical protein
VSSAVVPAVVPPALADFVAPPADAGGPPPPVVAAGVAAGCERSGAWLGSTSAGPESGSRPPAMTSRDSKASQLSVVNGAGTEAIQMPSLSSYASALESGDQVGECASESRVS